MKFVRNDGYELTEREYYSMVLREMENAWYDQMDEDEKEDFDNEFAEFVKRDFDNWIADDTDFECIDE